jgi:hypothetical protein
MVINSKELSIVGLSFNFVGAVLIWKFVPPSIAQLKNNKGAAITSETVEDAIQIDPKYRTLTRIGLILLVVGFLLQLIAVSL